MFNLGMGEMLIIAAVILIFIGPRQLPEVARTIAKFVNEWKRATTDLSQSLMEARDVTESAVKDAVGDVTNFDLSDKEDASNSSGDDDHSHPVDNDHSGDPESEDPHFHAENSEKNETDEVLEQGTNKSEKESKDD